MRLFGHPVHPMLVHLPVALWTLGTLCDGLVLIGFGQAWPFGWWCLVLGLAAALPAMAAGLADFARLDEAAAPVGLRHMGLMGGAWTMELIALLTRTEAFAVAPQPSAVSMASALIGFLLMALGAWHGGQLVYRYGAGVEVRASD